MVSPDCATVRLDREGPPGMFRLIVTVRRGSACNLEAASTSHATLETARLAGAALLRDERVQRVLIARDEVPPAFVEWIER